MTTAHPSLLMMTNSFPPIPQMSRFLKSSLRGFLRRPTQSSPLWTTFSTLAVPNLSFHSLVFPSPFQDTNQFSLTLSSSGVNQHHEYITLSKFFFPQFSVNIWLEDVELIIFDDSKHCAYDIILGRNIIKQFGFIINFAKNETSCLNVALPFLHRNTKPCTDSTIVQNFINDTPTTTSTNSPTTNTNN